MIQSEFRRELIRLISGVVAVDDVLLDRAERHYQLLCRWNERINLTSVIAPREAARKHYAESLILGSILPQTGAIWVDLGSGAGFPGFPVAALRPDLQLILVDADQRKASFLRECRDFVPGFRVVTVRGDQYDGGAEGVISRAVHVEEVLRFADRRPSVKHIGLLTSAPDDVRKQGKDWNLVELLSMPWDSSSVAMVLERFT